METTIKGLGLREFLWGSFWLTCNAMFGQEIDTTQAYADIDGLRLFSSQRAQFVKPLWQPAISKTYSRFQGSALFNLQWS